MNCKRLYLPWRIRLKKPWWSFQRWMKRRFPGKKKTLAWSLKYETVILDPGREIRIEVEK